MDAMDARMIPKRGGGLRGRLRDKLKAKVRYWVDGNEIVHWDDARNWLTWDTPSYPTVRMLESVPGQGCKVHLGAYSGFHYTVIVITGGQHHLDWVTLLQSHEGADGNWVVQEGHLVERGPVVVGSDVWVGYEALIMAGVTIGHGAAIAARAVITKNVEPYAIMGGNPAKVIRYRFEEPVREALLRISWWDWPKAKVAAHGPQIHGPEVETFVAKHDAQWPEPQTCEICANPTW